jgi:hypothetical protein
LEFNMQTQHGAAAPTQDVRPRAARVFYLPQNPRDPADLEGEAFFTSPMSVYLAQEHVLRIEVSADGEPLSISRVEIETLREVLQ